MTCEHEWQTTSYYPGRHCWKCDESYWDWSQQEITRLQAVVDACRPFARMAHPWPGTQLLVATRDEQETGRHDIEKELIFTNALFARMWAAWDAYDGIQDDTATQPEDTP